MRKQTKIAAIVSAAALLAIGASMTSFAATGWQEENGTWVYYDRSETQVTDTWEKSGSNWFYLNDSGEMATDSLIEDNDQYYYVDANGAMVANQWVAIDNEDYGDDDEPEVHWYYFQSNGKAYKRSDSATGVSLKTINGKKYTFDENGVMQFGWVGDDGTTDYDDTAFQTCDYYFGDENDGAMTIGWKEIQLLNVDDAASDQPGDSYWDEDQVRWFYFKASGKKQTNSDGKTINGKKYGFDEFGRMIADWYISTPDSATAAYAATAGSAAQVANYSSEFMYFDTPESGARYTKAWFKVVPGYYLEEDEYNDGSDSWYYADGNGKLYANVIKTIKGKKYAFQENGRMLKGLVLLQMDPTDTSKIIYKYKDDGDDYKYDTEDNFDDTCTKLAAELASGEFGFYYFSDSDTDGSMKTGNQRIVIDGDTFTFKFYDSGSRKGQGLTEIKDKKLYVGGKLTKASSDDKVDIVVMEAGASGGTVVSKYSASDFISKCSSHGVSVTVTPDFNSSGEKTKDVYTFTAPSGVELRVVNTSGSIVKSGSKTDGDDYKVAAKNEYLENISISY